MIKYSVIFFCKTVNERILVGDFKKKYPLVFFEKNYIVEKKEFILIVYYPNENTDEIAFVNFEKIATGEFILNNSKKLNIKEVLKEQQIKEIEKLIHESNK